MDDRELHLRSKAYEVRVRARLAREAAEKEALKRAADALDREGDAAATGTAG